MPLTPFEVYTYNRLDPLFGKVHEQSYGLKGASNATYPEYAIGVLLGELTATPAGILAPYNPGAADGTQNPVAIVRYPVQSVDASNNIVYPGNFQSAALARLSIGCALGGTYGLTQIIGLDANALTIMRGAVKEGVIGVNEKDTITLSAATNTFDIGITGPDGVAHNFLGFAGNVTAASMTATLQAVLGIGSVVATLSGLVYTLWFGGAWGTQAITVTATGHTITATAAQTGIGAAATVASGQKGIVVLLDS